MKKINNNKKRKTTTKHPPQGIELTDDEKLDVLADIIVDRVKERLVEEERLYQEKLKNDPKVKRFYETDEWKKRWLKNPILNKKSKIEY